jgi:hypothetical protein
MTVTVICLTHGPMQRDDPRAWWTCAGFDGEGCDTVARDEDIARTRGLVPGVAVGTRW